MTKLTIEIFNRINCMIFIDHVTFKAIFLSVQSLRNKTTNKLSFIVHTTDNWKEKYIGLTRHFKEFVTALTVRKTGDTIKLIKLSEKTDRYSNIATHHPHELIVNVFEMSLAKT